MNIALTINNPAYAPYKCRCSITRSGKATVNSKPYRAAGPPIEVKGGALIFPFGQIPSVLTAQGRNEEFDALLVSGPLTPVRDGDALSDATHSEKYVVLSANNWRTHFISTMRKA